MPASAPQVSVVIPTRDRWRFLSSAVEAALSQEGVELEVLVVDDGSRDENEDRLKELGDRRVTVVRSDRSHGMARARNLGIARARAEWVAFLDDDDLWAPSKLRTQLEAASACDGRWAYAAAVVVDERRQALRLATPPPPAEGLAGRLLARNVLPAGASNVIATTELVRELGGFDEELPHLADWDLWLRLAAVARPAVSGEVLVAYTHHEGNMLLQESRAVMADLERMAAKHRSESLAAGVEFDRVALSRWIAWGHRRAGRRGRAVAAYLRGAVAYRSAGNVVRAIAAALGEGVMRGPRSPDGPIGVEPDWLRLYR